MVFSFRLSKLMFQENISAVQLSVTLIVNSTAPVLRELTKNYCFCVILHVRQIKL